MLDWLIPARPPGRPSDTSGSSGPTGPTGASKTGANTVEIIIEGRAIPIAIRRHRRARRVVMRVTADGAEIRVTLPRWGQTRDAVEFAEAKRDWLKEQLQKSAPRRAIKPGAMLPFRGLERQIHWSQDLPRKPVLQDERIALGGPEEALSARLERWLREQAKPLLEQDLREYCAAVQVEVPALALSRAQRRWGSCSSQGTVRINWRLIMAPNFVRRSVVAHEVAHLIHFDHSPQFHALLGKIFTEGERALAAREGEETAKEEEGRGESWSGDSDSDETRFEESEMGPGKCTEAELNARDCAEADWATRDSAENDLNIGEHWENTGDIRQADRWLKQQGRSLYAYFG